MFQITNQVSLPKGIQSNIPSIEVDETSELAPPRFSKAKALETLGLERWQLVATAEKNMHRTYVPIYIYILNVYVYVYVY